MKRARLRHTVIAAWKNRWKASMLFVTAWLWLCPACGVVGPPISPEDVGIAAKVRQQQQKTTQEAKPPDSVIPIEEEPVQLPPLHSIRER